MEMDEKNRGLVLDDFDTSVYSALINEDSPTSDNTRKQGSKHRRRHNFSFSSTPKGPRIKKLSFRDVFRNKMSKHKKRGSNEILLDYTTGSNWRSCSTKNHKKSPDWNSVSWSKLFNDGSSSDKVEDGATSKKNKDAANPPVKKVVVVSLLDESKGTSGSSQNHHKLEYNLTTGLRSVLSDTSSDDDSDGIKGEGAASTASCTTATSSVSSGSVGSCSSSGSGSISHIIRDLTIAEAASANSDARLSPSADLSSLLPSLAHLTVSNRSTGSLSSIDEESVLSPEQICLVLLMDPKKKIFEIIQVPFYTDTTTVSALLEQLPGKATDERLAKLSYTGLAYQGAKLHQNSLVLLSVVIEKMNEFATEESERLKSLLKQVRPPQAQLLLPVPDDCSADEVEHIARILMKSPKVQQLIELHLAKMAANAVKRTVESSHSANANEQSNASTVSAREQIQQLYKNGRASQLSTLGRQPKHNPHVPSKTVSPFNSATVAL